jgi:hypothetical protein
MTSDADAELECAPLLPKNETGSTLGELWLQSRLLEKPKKTDTEDNSQQKAISPNAFRPLTLFHFRLAWELAKRSCGFYFGLVWQTRKVALVGAVLCSILSGVLPTAEAWSSAKLLNEVQTSLTTGSYQLDRIQLYAGLTIGLSIFCLLFGYVEDYTQESLRREMCHVARRCLLESKLKMDISGLLDPYRRDILEGAEVFAGERFAIDRKGASDWGAE